jgi:hypothetical protein
VASLRAAATFSTRLERQTIDPTFFTWILYNFDRINRLMRSEVEIKTMITTAFALLAFSGCAGRNPFLSYGPEPRFEDCMLLQQSTSTKYICTASNIRRCNSPSSATEPQRLNHDGDRRPTGTVSSLKSEVSDP